MDLHTNYLRLLFLILFIVHVNSHPKTATVEDGWELDLRTWRWNKNALAPVLIALGAKALALIPLALTGLTVMGSIAMLTAKLSLVISGFMFLKRFLSSDRSHGGFFGLNPFGFPRATISPHYHEKDFHHSRLH